MPIWKYYILFKLKLMSNTYKMCSLENIYRPSTSLSMCVPSFLETRGIYGLNVAKNCVMFTLLHEN
jgi:hypothetical protein